MEESFDTRLTSIPQIILYRIVQNDKYYLKNIYIYKNERWFIVKGHHLYI